MKRRSDAPLTILIIGISAVVMLGVGVIRYTGQTPVLQLPPAIKQRWGYEDVVARFKRGSPPWVEVEIPQVDRLRMAEVGAFALDKYRALAQGTQVEAVVVQIKGHPEVPPVTVNLTLAAHLASAQVEAPKVVAAAEHADLHEVDVQILGLSTSGVDLRVTGKSRAKDAADRTILGLNALGWIGRVEVEVEGARGSTTSVGGRDVPRRR